MVATNLRQFLQEYETAHPEDVIRITEPIRSEFECAAIARHFEERDQYPVIIFDKVINTLGEVSPFPCVINILGDRRKMAFALNSTYEDVAIEWARRVAEAPKAPVVVSREEAPVKGRVLLGDQINLLQMPMLRHHEMDPGPYITSGMLTTYDPETWQANMAFQRGYIAGPREIRCYITSGSHNALNLAAWEARGQEMKIAYWIGHHPAFIMGAHVSLGYPENHYPSAGAVAGVPIKLVPSETLGDDFLVPADAELVIEGVIRPGKRDLEGPFGEYPRYYGPQQMSPVFEVTAVTHRQDAIWHSFMVGINSNYSGVRMERNIYSAVKRVVPQVQRVTLPVSGCGNFHVYIQLKKTHDGQPRQAIMAALAASEWVKHVVVVDDDIDIFSDRWVLWAIATRSQWDKDMVIIPNCFSSVLDPSGSRDAIGCKGGIDATKPAPPARYPLRVNVPDAVMQRVQLEDFIEATKLAAVPRSSQR